MSDAALLPGQPRGQVVSGPATARAVNVLAPNASAMTLDGTNTWILAEPDSDLAVVVDPGPLDDTHLRAVIDTAARAAGASRSPCSRTATRTTPKARPASPH